MHPLQPRPGLLETLKNGAPVWEKHTNHHYTHKTTVPSLVWTTHSQLVHTPACNMQKSRGSLVINTSRLVGDHMALEKTVLVHE